MVSLLVLRVGDGRTPIGLDHHGLRCAFNPIPKAHLALSLGLRSTNSADSIAANPSTRVVLLVEDNLADADLAREAMEESEGDCYRFRALETMGLLVDYYGVRSGVSPR
jgi:hypothetical protein